MARMRRALASGPFTAIFVLALTACGREPVPTSRDDAATATESETERGLREVAAIHGGVGPWVVAGYRMGQHALTKLALSRQSFDLEVVHHAPREVKYSCIADGAAASTGASLGKLNLVFDEADVDHLATTYRRKSTGASVTLRPTATFRARFDSIPREQLAQEGRVVMGLPDAEIFEEVVPP